MVPDLVVRIAILVRLHQAGSTADDKHLWCLVIEMFTSFVLTRARRYWHLGLGHLRSCIFLVFHNILQVCNSCQIICMSVNLHDYCLNTTETSLQQQTYGKEID